MGDKSKIEWTEATWNPIVGCSVVSPGCTNCYAMRFAGQRLDGNPKTPHYAGTTQPSKAGPVWTGKVALAPAARNTDFRNCPFTKLALGTNDRNELRSGRQRQQML